MSLKDLSTKETRPPAPDKIEEAMPKKINAVTVDGVEYAPKALVEEALGIIGGLSQLYDDLAANPSEQTAAERKQEHRLNKRWDALHDKVYPSKKVG